MLLPEHQKWWDELPIIWKKIFTTHLYPPFENFRAAKQFYEQTAETELRQPEDLLRLFQIKELGFYKGAKRKLTYLPDLRYFQALETLSIEWQNIEDISGIAHCYNLQNIFLFGNKIKDISPLRNLKKLYWLFLGNNKIKDIKVLSHLNQLSTINLSFNKIRDISPLAKIKSNELVEIYLWGNKIKNLKPLSKQAVIEVGVGPLKKKDYVQLNYINAEMLRLAVFENTKVELPEKLSDCYVDIITKPKRRKNEKRSKLCFGIN